jgi:hypothetical protein
LTTNTCILLSLVQHNELNTTITQIGTSTSHEYTIMLAPASGHVGLFIQSAYSSASASFSRLPAKMNPISLFANTHKQTYRCRIFVRIRSWPICPCWCNTTCRPTTATDDDTHVRMFDSPVQCAELVSDINNWEHIRCLHNMNRRSCPGTMRPNCRSPVCLHVNATNVRAHTYNCTVCTPLQGRRAFRSP